MELKSKKGLSGALGTAVYMIPVLVLAAFLISDLSKPTERIEIVRTLTDVPVINDEVEMISGGESEDTAVTLETWWNQSLATPCNGIEKFHTGMDFIVDWNNMLKTYNKVYSNGGEEAIVMKPPSEIFKNSTDYDCEDIAHATRCLAEEYDLSCSLWIEKPTGPVVPHKSGHLGICCEISLGEWRCI